MVQGKKYLQITIPEEATLMALSSYEQMTNNSRPIDRSSKEATSRPTDLSRVDTLRGSTILATIPDEKSSSVYSLVLTTHEEDDRPQPLRSPQQPAHKLRSVSASPALSKVNKSGAQHLDGDSRQVPEAPAMTNGTKSQDHGPSTSHHIARGSTDARAALSSHPTSPRAGPAPSKPLPKIPDRSIPDFVARAREDAIRKAGLESAHETETRSPGVVQAARQRASGERSPNQGLRRVGSEKIPKALLSDYAPMWTRDSIGKQAQIPKGIVRESVSPVRSHLKLLAEREKGDSPRNGSKASSSRPSIDSQGSSRPSLQQERRERVRARKLRDLHQKERPNIKEIMMTDVDRGRPRERDSAEYHRGAETAAKQLQQITIEASKLNSQHIISQDGTYELPGLAPAKDTREPSTTISQISSHFHRTPRTSSGLSLSSICTIASVSPCSPPKRTHDSAPPLSRDQSFGRSESSSDGPRHIATISDPGPSSGHFPNSTHGLAASKGAPLNLEERQPTPEQPGYHKQSSEAIAGDGQSDSIYCTPDLSQQGIFESDAAPGDRPVSNCSNLTPKGQHLSAFFDHAGVSNSHNTSAATKPLPIPLSLQNSHRPLSPQYRHSYHHLPRTVNDFDGHGVGHRKSKEAGPEFNRDSFDQVLTSLDGLVARNNQLEKTGYNLERQNQLLNAALNAVLWTNGKLNGCPCSGLGVMSSSGPSSQAGNGETRVNGHENKGAPAPESVAKAMRELVWEPDAYGSYVGSRGRNST